MRKPEYLSPSALDCAESNPDEYFMRYLADHKPPKIPQTVPMAVGSAFDAFVKSYLHERLYGAGHKDAAKFELATLFESQVEQQCRDGAWKAGKHVFEAYVESGAAADLMLLLDSALDDVKFEFEVRGRIPTAMVADGVPLLGKPDLYFVTATGETVIFDFKVNGYCGTANKSPMAGFVNVIEQGKADRSKWFRMGPHKNCVLAERSGLTINAASFLEDHDRAWGTQLATYGWLIGSPVGKEQIVGIQQIVGDGTRLLEGKPLLRIATHCSLISSTFQISVLERYAALWARIESGHFFSELSREESDQKCAMLNRASTLMATSDPNSLEGQIGAWSRE